MSIKINLRSKKKRVPAFGSFAPLVMNASTILVLFLLVAAAGVYGYFRLLTNKSNNLRTESTTTKDKIRSFQNVEEQKSLVTIKTGKLQELYDTRFDYVSAINDVSNLFSQTIDISEMQIAETGEINVTAKKSQELIIDPSYQLKSTISMLKLTLTINSSDELAEIIRNITAFKAQGLISASVGGVERLEDGGYETELTLNFKSKEKNE